MRRMTKNEIEKHIEWHYLESVNFTKILSSICRQIAFAEGSLFWFLKTQMSVSVFLVSFGFFALLLYFFSDAAQYLIGYIKYQNLGEKFERYYKTDKLTIESYYEYPQGFHSWTRIPLIVKLCFLMIASFLLVIAFIQGLSMSS